MRRLWLYLLLVVPLWATAAVGDLVAPTYQFTVSSVKYFTPQTACDAQRAANGLNDRTCVNTSVGATTASQGNQTWNYAYKITATGTVSANQTMTASAYCDPAYYVGPGFYNTADQSKLWCKIVTQPPPTCKAGTIYQDWFPNKTDGVGFPVCADNGCAGTTTEVHTCMTYGSTGVRWCQTDLKLNGNTCNPSTDNSGTNYGAASASQPSGTGTPSTVPPTSSGGKTVPCPTGTVQGGFGIDGIPICIGTGSSPQNPPAPPPVTTKPPVTVNNSDGSTTTTQQTVQSNSDGSTTTTTTTTIVMADGTKTVNMGSSTSNNTSGTAGRQDTPNTDQMNLCKQNPMLSICQNSSVSGDCTTGIACTGDAIQCATLVAAQKLQCARQADEDALKASPSKTLGDSILAGADPSQATISALLKGDTADMSNPNLDQGGFVGGGACIPDKSFSVMGRTVTVSFATVCSNVQPLRYIVMACAFILVYLMVARSVING